MSNPTRNQYYLGLISGTSADGIDAALVRFDGDATHARPELAFGRTYPWDPALRARLVELGQRTAMLTLDEVGELDVRIGRAFAQAAKAAIEASGVATADIAAIGSHGQTLRHRAQGEIPFTLQLGDPSTIAERCGLRVVADFRRRDVAAGGHGAPLVPAFHAATLHSDAEDRAALNLGGIANFTLLPANGAVRGFDTGPANGLMDAWCLRHSGQAYDMGGGFAAQHQALEKAFNASAHFFGNLAPGETQNPRHAQQQQHHANDARAGKTHPLFRLRAQQKAQHTTG